MWCHSCLIMVPLLRCSWLVYCEVRGSVRHLWNWNFTAHHCERRPGTNCTDYCNMIEIFMRWWKHCKVCFALGSWKHCTDYCTIIKIILIWWNHGTEFCNIIKIILRKGTHCTYCSNIMDIVLRCGTQFYGRSDSAVVLLELDVQCDYYYFTKTFFL